MPHPHQSPAYPHQWDGTDNEVIPVDAGDLLDAIAEITSLPAFVEQTGGGTATIYVGYAGPDDRYSLAIGPGRFDWSVPRQSTFYLGDLLVGPDDEGQAEATNVNTMNEFAHAVRDALVALDPDRAAEVVYHWSA